MKEGKHIDKSKEGSEKKSLTRRDFISKIWKALGIIAGMELLGMLSAYFLSGRNRQVSTYGQLFEAGLVDSFVPGSVKAFMGGRFYLARQEDGGFIAVSLRCTHLGCSVSWDEGRKRFICPCHSSAFDISGEVLNPPASRALDYYPVMIENGVVKVDIGTLKERNSFRKEQLVYA